MEHVCAYVLYVYKCTADPTCVCTNNIGWHWMYYAITPPDCFEKGPVMKPGCQRLVNLDNSPVLTLHRPESCGYMNTNMVLKRCWGCLLIYSYYSSLNDSPAPLPLHLICTLLLLWHSTRFLNFEAKSDRNYALVSCMLSKISQTV